MDEWVSLGVAVVGAALAVLSYLATRDPVGRRVARSGHLFALAEECGRSSHAWGLLRREAETEALRTVWVIRQRRERARRMRVIALAIGTLGLAISVGGCLAQFGAQDWSSYLASAVGTVTGLLLFVVAANLYLRADDDAHIRSFLMAQKVDDDEETRHPDQGRRRRPESSRDLQPSR